VVTVVFDKPLAAGALDASNWGDLDPFSPSQPTSAVAVDSRVEVQFQGQPMLGVKFEPPPFDLLGENGLPVQAFEMPFD
jgi:hypothetical protein